MNTLYCFLGVEGFIFLKRGYLPFIDPAQLADPWLRSQTVYQHQATPKLGAEDFRQHLQQKYQELPDNLRAMISFEYFEQQLLTKREEIEQSLVIEKHQQVVQPFAYESVADWRVLSLYSTWQPTPLWQQFGASGKGMVLEFDLSKSGFKTDSYNQHAQHLSKIKCVQHWQPLDDLYYLFHRPREDEADEREWRLVRKLGAADRQIEMNGANRAMYRVPTKAVSRVILGYGCSAEYCQQVKLYLSQDIFYRHCKCVQAQLDPQTMRLQLVEL